MTRPLLIGGSLYGLALAVIALWPTHVDSRFSAVYGTAIGRWMLGLGMSYDAVYRVIEFSSNVLMYLPLGILTMMASPLARWWHAVVVAAMVSSTFELMQAAFRPGRTADISDVISNTFGAAIGAGCFLVFHALQARRSQPANR